MARGRWGTVELIGQLGEKVAGAVGAYQYNKRRQEEQRQKEAYIAAMQQQQTQFLQDYQRTGQMRPVTSAQQFGAVKSAIPYVQAQESIKRRGMERREDIARRAKERALKPKVSKKAKPSWSKWKAQKDKAQKAVDTFETKIYKSIENYTPEEKKKHDVLKGKLNYWLKEGKRRGYSGVGTAGKTTRRQPSLSPRIQPGTKKKKDHSGLWR